MRMFLFCILACISISLRASSDSEFNEFLKDCQIQRFCGSGSFGDVYEVHHKTLGRIALKSINCGTMSKSFKSKKKLDSYESLSTTISFGIASPSFLSPRNTLIACLRVVFDMNFEDLANAELCLPRFESTWIM